MNDPATCESYFRRIFAGVPGFVERLEGFRSRPRDPVAECLRLRRWLAANGPMDVCLLGLGVNGHLGFNEPAAMLQPFAHVAELSRASLRHAMLGSTKARPAYGLTFGIADLLAAREILLVVSGAHKREPLVRLLAGRVTPRFPATFLWLHPRVTLLCDRAAMGLD
jgi:galactosamine-6-phosphate isomerase